MGEQLNNRINIGVYLFSYQSAHSLLLFMKCWGIFLVAPRLKKRIRVEDFFLLWVF